jgi:homoserine kinase
MAARAPGPFSIVLPATSANLGPAFDAAALAFDLHLKVSARIATGFSIRASGRDAEICGRIENHLILTTYREVLASEGKPIAPLALRPDNAAACWMGGVAVARMPAESEAQVARIVPTGRWPLVLAVPEEALSTEAARRVLPAQYSRADAVSNIQNSMLLLAALVQGRADLLAPSLQDRIHQPYRAALCPLLPALQEMAGREGILGAVLSGAGPSVLVFVDPKAKVAQAKKRIEAHLGGKGLKAELIPARIDPRGARRQG